MSNLNKKAFGGLLQLVIILTASLFLPAWTINYWQAWVFLGVFSAAALTITIYLVKNDPKLLERRVNGGPAAEKEKSQRVIQAFASAVFLSIIIFPAIDHRFAWSIVPNSIVIVGDVFIATGFFLVFFVFKENTFTSATIEVSSGQTIVSTGPYSLVRHPMYIGALVLLVGIPPALGSWWGLLTIIPFTAVITWRLLDEEKFLVSNLAGYVQYQQKVKYRLLPFIW
jgi:protein-S-isoprenylcysteine O-methyltransferase Ste14